MTCKHHDKRSINGVMAGDGKPTYGGPPENDEEPAWCGTCGCLWAKSLFGWVWMHPKNDMNAPTLMNLMRENMSEEDAAARLEHLKEHVQDEIAACNKTTAHIEEASDIMRERGVDDDMFNVVEAKLKAKIAKAAAATEVMKEHGITIDEEKLTEIEKVLDEVERRKTKTVEAGARRGTKTDIAFTLAKTSQSLLNNDRILGLVLLVTATKGSFKGDGPLEVVYVRDGHPEAAQELQRTLDQRLPADLAWAEKTAAKEEGH